MHKTLSSRLIGFVASLILTVTAFFLVARPAIFQGNVKAVMVVILLLALLQFVVQCIFFLNLLSEKGPRWNLFVFISTLSIIVVIIIGSIWIMNHLNYNMMM